MIFALEATKIAAKPPFLMPLPVPISGSVISPA